ncbi:helix-turn-helix domain-containing protein [Paracoccus sp. TK19116]|uniref:Helix-turn-helix domain-containing protein n=1 Tax=Paracoccus albicereus TaxID=2922394 RepID=A0ABT1MML4_9RHOB|nr:helix-turn-helix domain-containing protein [Paracoccus albicereus]MCQ0969524.1 helix-turn-helix domain-containing protein [Paracoccus albicereus]
MNLRLARTSCIECPIRHRAVCAECDDTELAVLEGIKSYVTVPKGGRIAEAGESLDHLSSVVSGCATVSKTLADGRRQMVGLLLPSDFIGRPGRATLSFDIEAATDVTLCRFQRRAFEAIIRSSPNVARRLLTMTLDELDVARDWQVLLGRLTARERVIHFLLSLVRREATETGAAHRSGPVRLELPLSREMIADYLGLTIETTSRQFTALRKDGLIETPTARTIVVPDLLNLMPEAMDEDGGPIA